MTPGFSGYLTSSCFLFPEVTKPKRKDEEETPEEEEEPEEDGGEGFRNLTAVRTAALDKLKDLTDKYGRNQDEDFDDFDIGELDISDEESEN